MKLVGGVPTPLKNMKVTWDDDIPNIWKIKNVPNHQSGNKAKQTSPFKNKNPVIKFKHYHSARLESCELTSCPSRSHHHRRFTIGHRCFIEGAQDVVQFLRSTLPCGCQGAGQMFPLQVRPTTCHLQNWLEGKPYRKDL